jgi:hypothetical protein
MTIIEEDGNIIIQDFIIPKSKRQEKFVEMIVMNVDTPAFLPYFAQVKMLVGVTKQKKNAKKIQYSITAIEPVT